MVCLEVEVKMEFEKVTNKIDNNVSYNIDEILSNVTIIMNTLSISDDDTRQEIFIRALTLPHYCTDSSMIMEHIINPVLHEQFKILKNLTRNVPISLLNKPDKALLKRNIDSHNKDIKDVNDICDASEVLGMLHSYIINEYFIKQTDRSDIVKSLQITDEMFDILLERIISDIRSVLNK